MDTENLEEGGTTLMALKYDFGWLDTANSLTSNSEIIEGEGQTPEKMVTPRNNRSLKCKMVDDLFHAIEGGKRWISRRIVGEVKWYLENEKNNKELQIDLDNEENNEKLRLDHLHVDYEKIDAAVKGKIMLSVNIALHRFRNIADIEKESLVGTVVLVNRTRNECLLIAVGKVAESPHFFYYSSICSGVYFGSERVTGFFNRMQKTDDRESAVKGALLAMREAAESDPATGGFCTMFIGSEHEKRKCIVVEPFETLQLPFETLQLQDPV